MYSTCLFCARPLGRNDAMESFPVGRRLAFDPAKGRLWVVCPKCERWNLSPLETRWEAIEEAERHYRATPLRVSTDNVGLAQLSEGLELIRLGAPARPELAAWRYGDQFGRRRRRTIALGAAAVAAGVVAPIALPLGATALVGVGVGATLVFKGAAIFKVWSDTTQVALRVRDDRGTLLPLTYKNARCAALVPTGIEGQWHLKLPYRQIDGGANVRHALLTGDTAHRALATMLPHLNRGGGNAQEVREATDVIGTFRTLEEMLRAASDNADARKTHFKIRRGESNVGVLPTRVRLALEMVLHEDDERRAMEGDLHVLEQRWRDAEEIAAIADSLVLPPGIDEELSALRQRAGSER